MNYDNTEVFMKIGDFSVKSELSIDTLRYYDKIGLLVPSKENNIRNYSEEDLMTVSIIERLKDCDFTLDEIKQVLELESAIESDYNPSFIREIQSLFIKKNKLIDEKMKRMMLGKSIVESALNKIEMVLSDEDVIKKVMED